MISDTAYVRSDPLFKSKTHPDLLLIQQHTSIPFQITKVLNNNMIYTGIPATAAISKAEALTQKILWPHGNVNEDHLAPLGKYIDNTLVPLGTTWHQDVSYLRAISMQEY